MNSLSEKQIEDVFEVYYKQLLSEDFELINRQHVLENRLRIDLLFKDGKGKNVVVELKKDAVTREDIGQSLQYAGLVKNCRTILAAPYFADSVKIAFEHYGIEYLEFDMTEIIKLYKSLDTVKCEKPLSRPPVIIPQNVVKTPLLSAPPKDGNIAFKITYVDNQWLGVCSDKLYQINCFSSQKKTFCSIQAEWPENCRSKKYSNLRDLYSKNKQFNFPCYDSQALTGVFSPAASHGPKTNGQIYRALQAKVGKLALFTSRQPGEPESSRFIFMVAPIQLMELHDGFAEEFHCDVENAVFLLNQRIPFWNYHSNAGNPERIAWNTGLFRYVKDRACHELLSDIIHNNDVDQQFRDKAVNLLRLVP